MKRNIWFTSDTHFNHRNIIGYAQRPFESVEEMNEVMIERWNASVRGEDTIYHLGDFSFGGGRQHPARPAEAQGQDISLHGFS